MPAGFNTTPTTLDDRRLTDHDIYLFKQGTHSRLHEGRGANSAIEAGHAGVRFAVWAPNARRVSVTGDFNDWRAYHDPLAPRSDGSGIWDGFVAEASREPVRRKEWLP